MKTNREGLTLSDWKSMAQAFGAKIPSDIACAAWELGEDPSDYAAEYSPSRARPVSPAFPGGSRKTYFWKLPPDVDMGTFTREWTGKSGFAWDGQRGGYEFFGPHANTAVRAANAAVRRIRGMKKGRGR